MQNAVKVIAKDLDRAVKSNSRSTLLTTLSMIFNPARLFYQKVRFARHALGEKQKQTKTRKTAKIMKTTRATRNTK